MQFFFVIIASTKIASKMKPFSIKVDTLFYECLSESYFSLQFPGMSVHFIWFFHFCRVSITRNRRKNIPINVSLNHQCLYQWNFYTRRDWYFELYQTSWKYYLNWLRLDSCDMMTWINKNSAIIETLLCDNWYHYPSE